jgi:hypothetical protein
LLHLVADFVSRFQNQSVLAGLQGNALAEKQLAGVAAPQRLAVDGKGGNGTGIGDPAF